jgi:hypothetical protein
MSAPQQGQDYDRSRDDDSARFFRSQFALYEQEKVTPRSTFGAGLAAILFSFVSVLCLIVFWLCLNGQSLAQFNASVPNYDHTYTYIINTLFVLFVVGSNILVWCLFRRK